MLSFIRKLSLSGLAILSTVACSTEGSDWLTYENFAKIQNDMTYSQVVAIFDGNPGTLQTSAGSGEYLIEDYLWQKSQYSTRFVIVAFMNKKVTAKTQSGLR